MILESLHALYSRLAGDSEYAVAVPGFSLQKIAFAVVIAPDGRLVQFEDLREKDGPRLAAVQRLVPGQAKPSGRGLNPGFLWDNTGYLLGYKPEDPKPERSAEAFFALRERHLAVEREISDEGFSAVCRFLEAWSPARAVEYPGLAEFSTGFGVFRLQGGSGYVHEREAVRNWWLRRQTAQDADGECNGECLITGKFSKIAALHEPAIKGVNGAQAAGAKIVSFNCDAFTSYGKEQSGNAPVSEGAAFRYCTALNALLSGPRSSRHRLTIGDATAVFWTREKTVVEAWFTSVFSGDLPCGSQDPATVQAVRAMLEALRRGSGALEALGDNLETPFFFLGLSPNAARLSIRFWHVGTLRDLFDKLKAHYDALRIVRQFDESNSKHPDQEFPPVWLLLRQTARESKDIPPLLGGALMRAILTEGPYPQALAMAVINRIRADREITHPRAAILKAWLTRLPNNPKTIPMSLDLGKTDPAYRLGRLFATLEKTQQDALGGVNAGIRDRFYSSASTTPSVVFPHLLRTCQHHLAKLEGEQKVSREMLVQEIMGELDGMPRFLGLEEQAQFAIGYYHQRKVFYIKREPKVLEQTA